MKKLELGMSKRQQKIYNPPNNFIKMRHFPIIIFLALLIGCNDKNEEIYEYKLTLSGNIKDDFSKYGEEKECLIQLTANPVLSEKELEIILQSSDIEFKTDNNAFKFSDYIIKNNIISFKISCTENLTENAIHDKMHFKISNNLFYLEGSETITQAASDIRYEYKIESEITDTYTIPAEGGTFNIPIKCKRITYVNDKFILEEPYSLKGITYISNCVNIAWGHLDRIYKNDNTGDYIIELIAEHPYNIDGDFLWKVELKNEGLPLYSLNILHLQTPGEEFYIGIKKSSYESYLIEN